MSEITAGHSLTIAARAQGSFEARIAASLGSKPLTACGKAQFDERTFTTIYEGFKIGKDTAKKYGDDRCLGYRVDRQSGYQWMTYEETERAVTDIASGLIQLGENHGQKTFIGIYAGNSVEWLTVALACHFQSMVYVPLYDTLGKPAIVHIINQTSLKTIFVDRPDNVFILLEIADQVPTLKRIVLTKTLLQVKEREVLTKAQQKRVEILTYLQLLKIGQSKPVAHHPPRMDDIFEICYTSGTTGLPKGAMLTQKNIVSIIGSATALFKPIFTELETVISYLPLAHSYEQIVELYCLCNGFKIGYYLGDILQLSDDLAHLKPTFLPSVPRLLNRMFDTIQAAGRELQPAKDFLFNMVLSAKANEADLYRAALNKLWGVIVIQRVEKSLGGRVKLILSGAAPLSPTVLQFLRQVSGAIVLEGYGQTECCGVSSCQILGDPSIGTIGVPLFCNMIKLVDVPDMQYFAKNNVGELCIKGPNVFKGYYRDEEKTREAIDQDDWLHTGDIAKWTPGGQIELIDRKKHMFKLSQGEYIAPERIENIYIQSTYVAQAFVYGNSYKSRTVALIVPDPETLQKYANEKKLSVGLVELCREEEIKTLIFNDIKQLEIANGLKGFETAKDIYIHPEPFSIQNNLLTPTMKTKRPELSKYFEKQIAQMYQNID